MLGRRIVIACALIAASIGLVAVPAHATDLTVTKTADTDDGTCDADCSLREAIGDAIAGDTVILPAGTYQLDQTLGSLTIAVSLTIDGSGAAATEVVGNDVGETGFGQRIFDITTAGVDVLFDAFTIRGGELPALTDMSERGAGISSVAGSLTLEDMRIVDNHSTTPSAGIYQTSGGVSQLAIIASVIDGNTSTSSAGGVGSVGSFVFVQNSTISNNTSGANGGGIWADSGFQIERSTISDNDAGGDGGGLFAEDNDGVITRSTISGNTAGDDGAGIFLNAGTSAGLTASTLANNDGIGAGSTGSGFHVASSADSLTYEGSIIAENRIAGSSASQCAGAPKSISLGGNVIEDPAPPASLCPTVAQDEVAAAPFLVPLADNGGATQTHAIAVGSVAVDQNGGACPTPDQRGVGLQGGCDSGAYELHACRGAIATIIGTSANDILAGTSASDVIAAGDGADTVNGASGNDRICGESGNDILKGAKGKDFLDGGADVDKCVGGRDRDRFKGCEKVKQ